MSKELREIIKQLGASDSAKFYSGQVSEINQENRTVSVMLADGLEIENVRLTSTIDDLAGFLVQYPKVGSDVLVLANEGAWFVMLCSEIQKSHLKTNDFELILENGQLKVSASEVILNEGANKGLVNVEPLTEVLDKITAWMQKIDFVLRNTAVVTTAPGSPDGLLVALKAAVAASLVPNVKVYKLEDSKITH